MRTQDLRRVEWRSMRAVQSEPSLPCALISSQCLSHASRATTAVNAALRPPRFLHAPAVKQTIESLAVYLAHVAQLQKNDSSGAISVHRWSIASHTFEIPDLYRLGADCGAKGRLGHKGRSLEEKRFCAWSCSKRGLSEIHLFDGFFRNRAGLPWAPTATFTLVCFSLSSRNSTSSEREMARRSS